MKQIVYSAFKKFFLTLFLTLISIFSYSQSSSSLNKFWNNVYFGGGIGLNFGNNSFNGSLSPNAIYQINEQFATGIGLSFNYSKFNDSKLFAYGGSINAFYNPIKYIQLSSELEQLRINREFNFDGVKIEDNYWVPALYLGIGYTQNNYTIGIKYDVIHNKNKSIYDNTIIPFVRFYF